MKGDQYAFSIYLNAVQKKAEYICIDIEELTEESLVLRTEYYNDTISSEVQMEEVYDLHNGKNWL